MTGSVNVISPAYGFGYRADLALVADLLESSGFNVTRTPLPDIRKRHRVLAFARTMIGQRGRFDVNIFMGGLFPEWFPFARKNVAVPNVEDIAPHHVKNLRRIDLILAKTRLTERVFRDKGYAVEYTGFTSRDLFDPGLPRDYGSFFHACSSQFKGTRPLIDLWARHPEWPELVMTLNHHPNIPDPLPPNVRGFRKPLTEAEMARVRNTYVFQLCPSEVEGFGHYILEGMACRAVVMTTNHAPMNELVQPGRGFLLDIQDHRPAKGFSNLCYFKPESVEEHVERMMKLDRAEIEQIGANARAFYDKGKQDFLKTLPELVRTVATR